MKCTLCNRRQPEKASEQICRLCVLKLRSALDDLLPMFYEAHRCLEPHRGGHGTNSGEPTLGVNIAALDFITGKTILDTLHGWERVIREDRHLTPPALIAAEPTIADEIRATVKFHQLHMDWIATQPFADDYGKEIFALERTGRTAAQRHIDPIRRIECPGDQANGEPCRKLLAISKPDMTTVISCKRCNTEWTIGRLIAVALANPDSRIWIDAESIGNWLGLSESHVKRLARKHHIPRKGQLYDLQTFMTKARQ